MKNLSKILLIVLLSNDLSCQDNNKLIVSIADQYSLGLENMYNCYEFKTGMQLNQLVVFARYNYGGQYNYTNHGKSGFNDYNYHQVGLGLKYFIMKKKNKNVNPFVNIDMSTQIGSIYKNGLLTQDLRTTEPSTYSLKELSTNWGSNFNTYEEYDAWVGNVYYQSTTFIGSFMVGSDFRLFKSLYFNIAVGMGFRDVKIEKPVSRLIQNNWIITLDTQLGLSYSIPLKKKTTPAE